MGKHLLSAHRNSPAAVRTLAASVVTIIMAAGAGWWIGHNPSLIPFLAVAAAVILGAIIRQPRIWLALVMALTVFRDFDNVLAGGLLSWSKILTLVMLAIFLARVATRQARAHVFRDWMLPVVLILVWSTTSLLWAFDQRVAFLVVVSWVSLFALQGLIYTLFRDEFRAVETGIYAYIGAMMVFGAAAVYAVFLAPDSDFAGTVMGWRIFGGPSGQELGRFTGFYADANSTALLLIYAILLALALASAEQSGSVTARTRRYLLLAVALFLLLPLVITFSRTGLLAFLPGIIYLISRRGVGIRRLIVLAGAGGLVYLYQEGIAARFAVVAETGWGTRLSELETGLAEFLSAPITGIGLESFRPKLLAGGMTVFQGSTPVIHNTYLKFLVELGIPGFLLMLWLCVALIRRFRKNSQLVTREASPTLYWLHTGLGACFLSTAVFAIAQGIMAFNMFWILLGIFAVTSDAIEGAFSGERQLIASEVHESSRRPAANR